MMSRLLLFLVGALPLGVPVTARAGDEVRHDEKGPYLGILFGPRAGAAPSAKATPSETPPSGVLVTHVLPGSPAEKARLRRGDILLRYDQRTIRDAEHLAQLIRADKPGHRIVLVTRRDRRLRLVDATLALGPALKLLSAQAPPAGGPDVSLVNVWAAPQESGKMRLTIEYQPRGGKKKVITCEGAADVASAVQKLPDRERKLVRIAIERLNTINEAKPDSGTRR